MNRFYVSPEHIIGEQVRLSENQRKQIRNVLRLQPGDQVVVLDGTGREYLSEIKTLDSEHALAQIFETATPNTESRIRVILFQSLPKGDKIELVLQKCTEIGIDEFVIVETSRSVAKIPTARMTSRLERWNSIVREAVEQSGRVRLPEVNGVLTFADALKRASESDLRVIAWEETEGPTLASMLPSFTKAREIAYFVGPEGGFTREEVAAAQDQGFIPVSLGPRILRTETAAIVGAGLIVYGSESASGDE